MKKQLISSLALAGLLTLLMVASSDASQSKAHASARAASASAIFGKTDKATGSPYVFAMINMEAGNVTFPQSQEAAQAAIDYVNTYEDGINGHPIVLKECSDTTATAATSATCANELVADNPLLVLGAADVGGAGSFPVWNAHHLAYVGGSPFTPVESDAHNAVIFTGFSGPDTVATFAYATQVEHLKKVSIIATNDAQGLAFGKQAAGYAKADGDTVHVVPISSSASTSDFAAAAAQAESTKPDVVFVEDPDNCAQVLLALQQTGYSGRITGPSYCNTAAALKVAGSAANGFFDATPYVGFDLVDKPQWSHEIKLTEAILAKYAPSSINLDGNAFAAFGEVMNIRATLPTIKGKLDEQSILKAFETGSNHPNWLAHPYTCNRKQDPIQLSVCDAWQQIQVVKNGKVVTLDSNWVSGKQGS